MHDRPRHAYRGPVEANEPFEEETSMRRAWFKHIIVGWGDSDALYKRVSKSWKDESKRTHQYRTIEMSA